MMKSVANLGTIAVRAGQTARNRIAQTSLRRSHVLSGPGAFRAVPAESAFLRARPIDTSSLTPPMIGASTQRHFSTAKPVATSNTETPNYETIEGTDIPIELDPRHWGYDKAFVAELAEKIRDRVQGLSPEAIKIINRVGIDGMSLGALPPPQWYGLALFTQIVRATVAGVYDVSKLPADKGFEMSAGEGGIPPVEEMITQDELLLDSKGKPLIVYSPWLFKPTMDQDASGQFKKGSSRGVKTELKGGQNNKDGVGGRLPGKKNTAAISWMRNIMAGIAVPSPNNVPFTRSVEDLTVWRVFKEALNGVKPDIKISTAYNFVARALAAARAQAGVNIAGGREGRTGGTGSSSSNYRDNTVIDGLMAVRAFVEAMGVLGIDTEIAFSNNIFGVRDLVEALIVSDRPRMSTLILILLQNCKYAKTCDKACPVNITTNPFAYDPKVIEENVDAFFNFFEDSAQFARELGIQDQLDGRLAEHLIGEIFKPNPSYPDQDYAKWMAYQIDSKGKKTVQRQAPVKPSPAESTKQRDDEQQALFEANAGKEEISLEGAPGSIAFGARLQHHPERHVFDGVKILVEKGGTFFGGGNEGLDLYTRISGDHLGSQQLNGNISALHAGRQAGVGAQGGSINVTHSDSEALYRGGCVWTGETTTDSFAHYAGGFQGEKGHAILAGRAADYPDFSFEDNQDYPENREHSIGFNPFAAYAGMISIIPRTSWDHLTHNNWIQEPTYHRLHLGTIEAEHLSRIESQLKFYQEKMKHITGEEREIVRALLAALKSGVDPNELWVMIKTNPEIGESISPTMKKYLAQYDQSLS